MKSILFSTVYLLFNCLYSFGQNFSVPSQGSSRSPFIVTTVRGTTYVQRQVKKDLFLPYKIFLDTRSVLPDTSINMLVAHAKQMEKKFDCDPGNLVHELHFVCNKKGSFFDEKFPFCIFIATQVDSVSRSEISNIIPLDKRVEVTYASCLSVDYIFGITQNREFKQLMKKIKNQSLDSNFLNLCNMLAHSCRFSQNACLDTRDKLTSSEFFALIITTLNTSCSNATIMNEYFRTYPHVLQAYKEALQVTSLSTKDALQRFGLNKTSIPIVIELEDQIDQITKIQSGFN